MPEPVALPTIYLGPGVLSIGAVGSELDISCQVNNMKITVDKSEDDARVMLCGNSKPGKVTYTFALEGNVDTDIDDPAGFFALSQDAAGTVQPFTFTPNTEAVTTAAGSLVIDPLEFGADESGDPLQSDLSYTIIGKPTYTYPAAGGGALVADDAELVDA